MKNFISASPVYFVFLKKINSSRDVEISSNCFKELLIKHSLYILSGLDYTKLEIFSWAMSHICANDEYRSRVGATNRPQNIVIRYVSVVSLCRLFACFQFSFTDFSLRLCADISKVTAHERIQYLYRLKKI
jgi:hypothetical protein